MATKIREYILKVPFTLDEWRKGQRYILAKYTTDEVTINKISQRKENGKLITECIKTLNISKRLPSLIMKVISSKSLLIDEFSVNIDEIKSEKNGDIDVMVTDKEIKGKKGLLDKMSIVETNEVKHPGKLEENLSCKNLNTSGGVKDVKLQTREDDIKPKNTPVVSSSCETNYVSKYYDANTFSLTVKTMVTNQLQDNIFSQKDVKSNVIDLSNGNSNSIYVYKLITVTVNSMLLGWICDQVKKLMKNLLIQFQEKMIATHEEWKNITEEELVELEKKMIETFMKSE